MLFIMDVLRFQLFGSTDMHAQTQQHQDGKKDKVIQFVEILEREQQIVLNNPFTHISSLKKI